jgi:A1 cistron-splicing factor AAR2
MGDKIVPGAYQAEDQDDEDPMTDPRKQTDGTSIAYPPVPVLLPSASGDSRHRHRSLARHAGTRRFLSGLGPGQRTALATEPSPPARVLEAMLRDYYGGSWRDLVGDVQLSFLLFLHLHCFASLSHWRDLVAMLSCVEPRALRADLQDTAIGTLYPGLLETLSRQVTAVDPDFFDDAELSGENELVPSLRRLLQMRPQAAEGNGGVGGSASSPSLAALGSARARLEEVLQQRFPSVFANDADGAGGADEAMGDDSPHVGEEDDVEEDGPAVVAGAEVDASLARIAAESAARGGGRRTVEYPAEIRGRYPLLFAAMLPAEDAVMTCARALDDANDASLVREAADYLQQVEARVGRDGGSAESCSS